MKQLTVFSALYLTTKVTSLSAQIYKRESNVFDSKDIYMVLWIDTRLPYICKEKEKTSFGWVSKDGGMVLGNVENSCQFYYEFVIGFIKVNDEYMDNDEKLFDEYVTRIKDDKEE